MWKERLRVAKFKGIEFSIEDHELESGRRLVVNEYVGQDLPYIDHLGKKARRYAVTGFLVGDNYMDARDALLDAVEAGGAGELIHPYYGAKRVFCEDMRLRERKDEGGYVVVAFSFVESGEKVYPSGSASPSDAVNLQADSLIESARASFVENIKLTSVPEFVRNDYSQSLQNAAGIFKSIQSKGGINIQDTSALINEAAEWVANVSDLASPAIGLITDPAAAADRLIDSFNGVFTLAPSIDEAIKNLQRFKDFAGVFLQGNSEQAQTAEANAQTTESFVSSLSISNQAKAIVNAAFLTFEDAVSSRQEILDQIDSAAGKATDDDIYESLRKLRKEISGAVPGESSSLPRLTNLKLAQSMPSLALAYDLYGDLSSEQDIIDRNNVRHPGFVQGGETLSVLENDES